MTKARAAKPAAPKPPAGPPTRSPAKRPARPPTKGAVPRAKKPRQKLTVGDTLVTLETLRPHRKTGPALRLVNRRKPGDPEPLLQRAFRDPAVLLEAWRNRPQWIDDFGAILLISFGLVSIFTLLSNPSVTSTALSDMWADFISQVFGRVGAIIFSLFLIATGALIVLPRVGVRIHMPWRRVLAIEIAFLAFLALLHLIANDPEPRSLARSGQGGGHVGWALAEIMALLFGSALAALIYFVIFAAAVFAIFGIRRKQMRTALKWTSVKLEAAAEDFKTRAMTVAKKVQEIELPRLRERPHVVPLQPGQRQPGGSGGEMPPLRSADSTAYPEQTAQQSEPVPPAGRTPAPSRAYIEAEPGGEAKGTPAMPRLTPTAVPPPQPAARQPAKPPLKRPKTPLSPQPTQAEPARPTRPPLRVPSTVEETADETPDPAVPSPVMPSRLRPIAANPVSTVRDATTSPTAPERRTRHFTVEDFREAKHSLPRDGLPPITLLDDTELNKPTEQEINNNARIIENTLLEFDIDVEVVDVKIGPTVTQYAVQPFREVTTDQGEVVTNRVRVNKIVSLAGDLALALAAKRLRVQPYVPGHSYMGIEVPNHTPGIVALRRVMESEAFAKVYLRADPDAPGGVREAPLTVPLGRDVSGDAVVVDLAAMPHLLIAGTTGSGKSVCITSMITALVMNNTPDRVKLVLLDPKMVELPRFNGLPHMLGPVETDMERIIGVLRWATREMDRRYKLLEEAAARNIEVYNRSQAKTETLPYIAVFVDEIGDLMLSRPDEMERTVTRLAQMARAVGIHLVIATQRPSTDIITGLIKANFPARISFAVASGVDSRVILDTTGAETLIGRGDMLYLAPDAAVPRRVQGCFVSDEAIDAVMDYWKRWKAAVESSGRLVAAETPWERGLTRREALAESDTMLEDAIDLVVREGEASPSLLQKRLGVPYTRAAQLMDLLSDLGILGATRADGRTREVTMKPGTDSYKRLMAKYRKR